jgi:hypothetical protein
VCASLTTAASAQEPIRAKADLTNSGRHQVYGFFAHPRLLGAHACPSRLGRSRCCWNDIVGRCCRSHRGDADCLQLRFQHDHNLRLRARCGNAPLDDRLRMRLPVRRADVPEDRGPDRLPRKRVVRCPLATLVVQARAPAEMLCPLVSARTVMALSRHRIRLAFVRYWE